MSTFKQCGNNLTTSCPSIGERERLYIVILLARRRSSNQITPDLKLDSFSTPFFLLSLLECVKFIDEIFFIFKFEDCFFPPQLG